MTPFFFGVWLFIVLTYLMHRFGLMPACPYCALREFFARALLKYGIWRLEQIGGEDNLAIAEKAREKLKELDRRTGGDV